MDYTIALIIVSTAAVSASIFIIAAFYTPAKEEGEVPPLIVISVIIGFAFFVISYLMVMVHYDSHARNPKTRTAETRVNVPIQSIERAQTTSGSFFLGSGSFNQTPSYFYYKYNKQDDTYSLGHTPATGLPIRQDSSQEPHLVNVTSATYNGYTLEMNTPVEIVVPNNTIMQKYNIN